jgi:hypothetical protein
MESRNFSTNIALIGGAAQSRRLLFSGPATDGAYGIYITLVSNLETSNSYRSNVLTSCRALALWKCSKEELTVLSASTNSLLPRGLAQTFQETFPIFVLKNNISV